MSELEPPPSSNQQEGAVTDDAEPIAPPQNEASSGDATAAPVCNIDKVDETSPVAAVRKNIGESISTPLRMLNEAPGIGIGTPVRSRPNTPARSDSPLPITPIPCRSEVDLISKAEEEQAKTCPKWSDVLKTPSTTEEKFSPSKPLNKPGSLHGLGKNQHKSIRLTSDLQTY